MPRALDWWEQGFQSEQRAGEITRLRTRRAQRSGEKPTRRSRDRPVDPLELVRSNARHFEDTFAVGISLFPLRPDLKVLRHLAVSCWERSRLLDGVEASRHADALIALSAHWRNWLRPLDEWQPPGEDASGQFASLARHLLAQYDVPRFLDSAWLAGLTPEALAWQGWFKLLGSGGSIRSASDLPLPLNRRMAHHFLQAPADLDIPAAFRYAQVLGLGGDERLARSLLTTRLGTDFTANDFWETVIRWLITHPHVEPLHHGPIIDYLHDQKFVPSVPSQLGRGQPRLVPPRPHLCMQGRRPDSLLRAVEEWHRRLRSRQVALTDWKPSGLPPLTIEQVEETGRKVYAITELLSTTELQEEGAALSHCVATYWALCRSGESSLWSLTAEDSGGRVERLLTLEVRNWRREVVQARGKCNRPALPHELHILALWTQKGGPNVAQGAML
jgi:hypothetical protein